MTQPKTQTLQTIPLQRITISRTESQCARRAHFDAADMAELVESVKAHGILQPIIVRPHKGVPYDYQLVAGERRLAAALKAKLVDIPAVVRELSDEEVIEVQLIENLQRQDLHPMHEAEGYHELMSKHGHAAEELGDRVGKSRSYVYARLKLLALAPKVRKAFYADEISASIALLLARIPVEKLQLEALGDLVNGFGGPVPFRRAQEIVRDRYMLRLADASFPTDHLELNGAAGACGTCPKRTGNQPELFGDVKGPDVCTDPTCFAAKTKTWGRMVIAQAKKDGQPVIVGKEAKKVAPHGADRHIQGWARLDEKNYNDAKTRKNRAIVGADVEVTLLQDPESGQAVEVVRDSVVNAALNTGGSRSTRRDDGSNARRKKALLEGKVRRAVYAELRQKLKTPSLPEMAIAIFERLEHDAIKVLATIRDWTPPQKKQAYGSNYKDFRAIGAEIPKLKGAALGQFVNDMIFARDIQVATWSNDPAKKLYDAAKAHGVDVARIRRELAPAPKTKAGKKKRSKKAAKKTRTSKAAAAVQSGRRAKKKPAKPAARRPRRKK